jgi:hypothetical protein
MFEIPSVTFKNGSNSSPVLADLAEQAMLDGIPFRGTGRVVTDGDAESQAIAASRGLSNADFRAVATRVP